ncbi:MAG: single-stranded-DNA-specific exonuclease RecJ [Spirochaetaceae bacterium]|nr:MAG: single-stranded-DNA-specific exonuclease RecJ [Spirochaetaceae bacterium]
MKWTKSPVDTERVKSIARRYDLDLLAAAILVRRSATEPATLPYWLESDLRYLHDPFLFEDMPELVDRVMLARDEEERVLVFGDRDVDGITSTAVMVDTLQSFGINVQWQVPEGDDSYGLTLEAVEEFARNDGSLIITVDCGVTSIAEIERALELGIDTIVVDHHNPPGELPPAVAIIDPKVGDTYPFDGLCACAVVAKVRQALALAQTEVYGQSATLLNARPLNDAIMVDVIALENGLEVDRLSEALVPGVARLSTSRLEPFLLGRTLACYDEPLQRRLLQQALGPGVDIYMVDLADSVRELFPALGEKSLLEMREGSRLARYTTQPAEEIDVLLALYQAILHGRFPAIRGALDSVLDLVALATLADMMPIVNENRTLVKLGLERLNVEPQPGLAMLLRVLKLNGRKITSRDVSWLISPVINASGRMGTPSQAVKLLLSREKEEQERLAQGIEKQNRERRRVGEEGWRSILPRVEESLQRGDGKIIVLHEPEIHRGVTGILAGRLSRRYNVPATVLTSVGEHAVGSIRSARGFVATEFLQKFSDILDKWGGHDEAAGFNLLSLRLEDFWERMKAVLPDLVLEEEQEAEILVDAELPARYLNPRLEELVARFEPYGQANPELRFLARKMVLEELQIIGKEQNHLKMLLAGGGYKWPALYWGAAERVARDFQRTDRVDVVFEVTWNHYNGNATLQLLVVDMARSPEQLSMGGPEPS